MQKDYPFGLIQFYATAPYACSYLPDQTARSQVATPGHLIDTHVYSELVRNGFRRSGVFTYRPYCDHCKACIPVRVPVAEFKPNRSQRRALRQHHQLVATEQAMVFTEEIYTLYQTYQGHRHAGGGMDQDNREQFSHFLLQSHVDTRLVTFRENGVLRMVSVIDRLDDGLSSVYTFFDTSNPRASYGTFGVLWQIAACERLRLPYLYLGYWIERSPKMAYKRRFAPLELRVRGEWQRIGREDLSSFNQ